MTRPRLQIFATLLVNFILWSALAEANYMLGPWQLRLWLGGLLVAPSALRLDFQVGATAAFVTGLALDAAAPVAFGTQALLLLAGHVFLFHVRDRLARNENLVNMSSTLLANLALFLVLSFTQIDAAPAPGRAWLRLFADLLASQVVLALVTSWAFALHGRLLLAVGADLRREHGGTAV